MTLGVSRRGRIAVPPHVHDASDISGQIVDASEPRPWKEWVPAWTGATADPAIGNGTLIGRYYHDWRNKLVHARMSLVAGSTTTFGTGGWFFDLPVDADTALSTFVGVAHAWDLGADNFVGAVAMQGADLFNIYSHASGQTPWQAGTPMTWTTGDYLRLSLTYEAA